jgi:RNA polymerase sigma factor (sigma-70 family)
LARRTNEIHPFGERDWNDVRMSIKRHIQRKWRNMPPEDVEDAVSDAITDLFDYWLHLPSSVDDSNPAKNFAYAVRRGTWVAGGSLVWRFHEYAGVVSEVFLNQLIEADVDGTSLEKFAHYHQLEDPAPQPDDVCVEAENMARLQRAVNALSEDELNKWFRSFMGGETAREAADHEGVTHQSITERRQRGIARLKKEVQS